MKDTTVKQKTSEREVRAATAVTIKKCLGWCGEITNLVSTIDILTEGAV